MELKTTSIGYLCSLLTRGPNPIFLLGAGASVTSGIPLADEMVEQIAREEYCIENRYSPEDLRIRRSDWYPWLEKQRWYREEQGLAAHYPYVVENILQPRERRRRFFRDILSTSVPPSSGYERMAELIARKVVRTVLTTNFDTILPEVCKGNRRIHDIDVIQTTSDYTQLSTDPANPQIVYLHGSVDHYTDKNSLAEIYESLDKELVSRLVHLLRDHPLIVIGYRGAERSVMQHLLINHIDETDGYRHGIYWCVRNDRAEALDSLPQFVHELAGGIQDNFQIVPIVGFDEVMEELWEHVSQEQFETEVSRVAGGPEKIASQPYDLRNLKEASIDDFEWPLLRTRLVQYCERTDIRVPGEIGRDWIIRQICNRDIAAQTETGEILPTVGGYLLFAQQPQHHIQTAQVIVRLKGPREWLANVLDGTDDDDIGGAHVERIIEGHLWSQLEAVYEILALVNQPFLLKDEVSKTTYPYPPDTLREIVVNALVHRDYELDGPIVVEIEQTCIRVQNPGGLIPEVDRQVKRAPDREIAPDTLQTAFENQIKGGIRGIKGYRNAVVADLFYGAETMEKAGSGLSEVWRSGQENNNEVNFGPINDNTAFEITLHRRPEVVDEVTRTAAHSNFTRHASNLLEVVALPDVLWHAETNARKPYEILENVGTDWVPPFILYEGKVFSFYDLSNPACQLHSQIRVNTIEKVRVEKFIADHGERCFVWLLNECLFRHLKVQGLWIDRYRKRAYFLQTDRDARTIEYQARVRRATRTVVKKKNRYWEHKSFWFRFERFEDTWTLGILPGYVFTTDGKSDLLAGKLGKLVNWLSTKREGRDYNNIVHNDLVFWAWVLSAGQHSSFALNMGHGDAQDSPVSLNENHDGSNEPQILMKAKLSTTVVHNVAAEDVWSAPTEMRNGLWAQQHNVEAEDALHYKHIEELERNRLAQLESEFAGEISQLPEVKDANSN